MPAIRDGDLRSEAKDRQRVKTHTVKWSRGAMAAPGKWCTHMPIVGNHVTETCADCAKRPWHVERPLTFVDPYEKQAKGRAHTMARKAFRSEADQALDEYSDNSGAEEFVHESVSDHVMYSYDAHAGPGQGSQVLSHAIIQAVERFENKETEKIVREYDLVADGHDEVRFDSADDDFELVHPSQL